MRFGIFKKKSYTESIEYTENKIHLKDFMALCIAAFQVILPVILIIFAAFSFGLILLMKFWIK